ncbi:MAG: hypothetical protein KJ052_07450 [Candidatus Hydrogenedentes bacterium]|nr:hypothetical protein [Candidatus Hydrogenedentota bacterium]
MARTKTIEQKTVDPEVVAGACAKAVYDGDIVNFRTIFAPFSPARQASGEEFIDPKYAYLLPDSKAVADPEFERILKAVQAGPTWQHIQTELDAKRLPRLPSELLVMLADRAVKLGKFSSAAQTYEVLRIRGRMQEEFLVQADKLLEQGDLSGAVRGYVMATGLAYDYAAFPEPLPLVPNYQTRALILHGEYPLTPEESVPLYTTAKFLSTAFTYLLLEPEIAGRLQERPEAVQLEFLAKVIEARDPEWREFTQRWREAVELAHEFERRFQKASSEGRQGPVSLEEEIEQVLGDDPQKIPALLLGRSIADGEWWQYLKELAGEHAPAALFVARQAVGPVEILVPRYRGDSPVVKAVGLLPES